MFRLALVAALIAAVPVHAQSPFQRPLDRAGELAAFRAEIRAATDKVIDAWKASWERNDAGATANHYTDDAVLIDGPGSARYSKALVAEYLATVLPAMDSLTLSVADFDATATLAYASGRYSLARRAGTEMRLENGVYVLVLKLDRGKWRIRSQVMMPETAP